MSHNNVWVEKYRPKKLDDLVAQKETIEVLKHALIKKNLPNLLFYGPAGCGKTSSILALCREIFGPELYNERVLEFNASDDRGINFVREKIKYYAKYSINNTHPGVPNWKMIILDEADSMTPDSQFALRRVMEKYSKFNRFCIICNYQNKIIQPILSRCACFRFNALPTDMIQNKLSLIADVENIKTKKNELNMILEKIVSFSNGDLRKAINYLQRFYTLFGNNMVSDNIDEVMGLIPNDKLTMLIDLATKKKEDKVFGLLNDFMKEGFSLGLQLSNISQLIIRSNKLSDKDKAIIACKLGEIENHLSNGCNEYIQFYYLLYTLMALN